MTNRRVMGIDPGEKRIGIAISDETATLARPLSILPSTSRAADAENIQKLAEENQAGTIVVGQSLDENGKPNYQGRKAARLAKAIASNSDLSVLLWDESFSTVDAQRTRREMGVRRNQREGHLDDAAASLMLQSYLDAKGKTPKRPPNES